LFILDLNKIYIKQNTDGIIDKLSPSKSCKKLEKNYTTLPLIITDEITNELSLSKSSKEFEKNTENATNNI
jgi:hypothetical protein